MSSLLSRLRRIGQPPAPDGPKPILEGPIPRTLLGLSLPMIAAMFLVTANGLVDMLYLGRLSRQAMAAVGVAFPVTFLLHTMAGALGTAGTSLSSRLFGAGDETQVRNLLWHVLLSVAAIAAVLTPATLLLLRPVVEATGSEAAVIDGALLYGRTLCSCTLLALLPMNINALFRGEGDSIFPFRVMASALTTNILLDPVFIFGFGPVPAFGVQGAAMATLCGYLLAVLIIVRELRNPARRVRFDRRAWRFDPSLLKRLAAVAAPAALGNLSMPISVGIINRLIRPFGTESLAALSASTRLLAMAFLPALGLAMGMLIMVGQNHAANLRRRVRSITLTTIGFAMSMLALMMVPLLLFPEWALAIFTDDRAVIDAGVPLVRWIAPARPVLSIVMITAFWFNARGRGLAGMVPNSTVRVLLEPIGLYVGLRWGGALMHGWQGIALADVAGGLLSLAWLLWRLRVYVAAEKNEAPASGAS